MTKQSCLVDDFVLYISSLNDSIWKQTERSWRQWSHFQKHC